MTPSPQAQGSPEQTELAETIAKVAATMYGALLKVEVDHYAVKHFTPDQAFALVNSVFYQAVKDEDLI